MTGKSLESIVGNANIIEATEELEKFSSDLNFAAKIRPKVAVKVKTPDEVQELIKWANETRTVLVPVSSGPPHFRGSTIPGSGGAVVVDLSGMKRIIRVDARNRVAMIEPGVSFSELIPRLAQEGLRLNLPLLPRKTKSVVASMLDREPVLMPLFQWDIQDPLTCIEVVFGSGDLFRTGSAAGPGTLEQQWAAKQAQVNPMGPGQTDIARIVQGSQGTMGIVTWATVKCERIPELQKPFIIGAADPEKLIELVYRLIWLKIIDECVIVNGTTLAAMVTASQEEYNRLKNNLPQWILFFCLSGYDYFPEERVVYQEKEMMEAAQHIGIEPGSSVTGISAFEMLKLLAQPSDDPHWKLRQKGACHDVFFQTTMDKVPKFTDIMFDEAGKRGYSNSNIGIYIQPLVQGTSCHVEFELFYNPADAKESARIKELGLLSAEALMNAGAFFSRPYGAICDLAYRRDAETTSALRKVKQIFDANNIMNSGKLCF